MTPYLDIRTEVVLDLPQDELNVILGRGGIVGNFARGVGGASDGATLPRKEKNDPTVGSVGVQQAHLIVRH